MDRRKQERTGWLGKKHLRVQLLPRKALAELQDSFRKLSSGWGPVLVSQPFVFVMAGTAHRKPISP